MANRIKRTRQKRKDRRQVRRATPSSVQRAISRPRSVQQLVRAAANASPQAQGINTARRQIDKVNRDNRRRRRSR